jgi:hypothetical protein
MSLDRRLRAAEEAVAAFEAAERANPWKRLTEALRAALGRLQSLGLDRAGEERLAAVVKWFIDWPVAEAYLGWPAALADLLTAVPADLRPAVLTNLAERLEGGRADGSFGHTLDDWLRNLAVGRSRLPDGLSEGAMRRLLGIYWDRAAEIDQHSVRCDGCGLERPMHRSPPVSEWRLLPGKTHDSPHPRYDLPEFFAACPHCGEASWGWTHLHSRTPTHADGDLHFPHLHVALS